MIKYNLILFFTIFSIFLTCCDIDSDGTYYIIRTKWNKIDYISGVNKTITFENSNKAYMMDKVIRDEPIEYKGENYHKGSVIYTYYTYTFDKNTCIGRLEAIDENLLGADFLILGNRNSMLIKNDVVEMIFNKIYD